MSVKIVNCHLRQNEGQHEAFEVALNLKIFGKGEPPRTFHAQ